MPNIFAIADLIFTATWAACAALVRTNAMMTAGSNALCGATVSCAAARMSSPGVGKRSQAEARSRSARARPSTARSWSGSRLLSSGFVIGPLSAPNELQIFDQRLFFVRRKIVFGKGGHAPVSFFRAARHRCRNITRHLHDRQGVDPVKLRQRMQDIGRGLLNPIVLD